MLIPTKITSKMISIICWKPVKIDIEIINAPTVEKGIAAFCDAKQNDLLIIIKRDYGLVEQLFHRNIFAEILQKQSLPIMVVHY